MADYMDAKLGIMIDIETLDTGPNSLMTQVAMQPFRLDDEEPIEQPMWLNLPMQPQLDLVRPRTISAKTLNWWMQQPDEKARANFELVTIDDMHSLKTAGQHIVNEFGRMTKGFDKQEVEVWARGPQFDVVNVETLLTQLGFEVPWDYNMVRDLRTLMAQAHIHKAEVEKPARFVEHDARWDCSFQIMCYFAAQRKLTRAE